jgi:hypothetical protein
MADHSSTRKLMPSIMISSKPAGSILGSGTQLFADLYEDIEIPIERITEPELTIDVNGSLNQYINYIQTRSAV